MRLIDEQVIRLHDQEGYSWEKVIQLALDPDPKPVEDEKAA